MPGKEYIKQIGYLDIQVKVNYRVRVDFVRFYTIFNQCHCEERQRRSNLQTLDLSQKDCFAALAMTAAWGISKWHSC